MRISYSIADGIFDAGNLDELLVSVKSFLSEHHIDASVAIDEGTVVVDIDDPHDIDANEDMSIALGFCNARRFGKAKKVLKEFLSKKPYSSEAYRLLAQIAMEEREIDNAIETCLDALRLDPRNCYALILMGNLYAREKGDKASGMKYFKRVLEIDPNSQLAAVNYAALLVETGGDSEEAIRLYRKAIEIEPDYLNAYYGLAGILDGKGEPREAFDCLQTGLARGKDRPENPQPLRQIMAENMLRIANKLIAGSSDKIEEIRKGVSEACGREIRIEKDESITSPAKMERAEKYGRAYHRLAYNDKAAVGCYEYSIIHELLKWRLLSESGKARGQVAVTRHVNGQENFVADTGNYISDKLRRTVQGGVLKEFLLQLMDGVGSQQMNCPLDFITTMKFYGEHADLRPLLTYGAYQMIRLGAQSVATGVKNGFPKNVVRLNRVMNAVAFMQYRDLLGLDFVDMLSMADDELKQAKDLYAKCRTAAEKYYPGAEWELVRTFIAELHCDRYFALLGAGDTLSEQLRKEESVDTFHRNVEENPAIGASVMMYMVDAIKRLRELPIAEVKKIAFDIAMLGMNGINPGQKSGYSVPSLGGEDMSGCRMLAYYYVSWALAIPEKVDSLGLPFAAEYEQAKTMAEKGL